MTIYPNKNLVKIILSYLKREIKNDFKKNVEDLKNLQHILHQNEYVIDYDNFALSFLWLYYFANFAKVNLACKKIVIEKLLLPFNMLDLGCGNGASTVGFLEYLHEREFLSRMGSLKIDLVDHSKKQLDIFNETSNRYINDQFNGDIKIDTYCSTIEDFLKSYNNLDYYGLIVLSNVLCEIPESYYTWIIEKIANILSSKGTLLVVEREKTGVVQAIKSLGNWLTYEVHNSGPHKIEGLDKLLSISAGYPPKTDFKLFFGVFKKP